MATTIKQSAIESKIKLGQATGVQTVKPVIKPTTVSQGTTSTQSQAKPTSTEAVKQTVEKQTTVTKDRAVMKSEAILVSQTMRSIASEMKAMFLERDEIIDDMFLALIAGHHVLLLGPPGTGKSFLTNEFTKRIDNSRIFEWLLNRTSDPSEILGPISIKNMERDKFVRILDNKIGDCEVAFLDEINIKGLLA